MVLHSSFTNNASVSIQLSLPTSPQEYWQLVFKDNSKKKKKKEEMLDQRIYTLSVLTGAGFQNKSASSPRAAPGGLTDGGGLIASGCISELIQRMSFFSTQRPVTFLLSDGLFTTSNVTHKLVLLCICQGSAESHHSRDQIK